MDAIQTGLNCGTCGSSLFARPLYFGKNKEGESIACAAFSGYSLECCYEKCPEYEKQYRAPTVKLERIED